jgi:hypothetical protein
VNVMKMCSQQGHWLMPVIPPIWESEISRIMIGASVGKTLVRPPIQPITGSSGVPVFPSYIEGLVW